MAITGAVNTAAVGSYSLGYSVADGAGNVASAVRTVNVSDTLAPSLALVGASAMKLECGVDSFTNPGATASDACSGDLSSAIVKTGSVNTAAVGSYSLGYSVADAAGHAVSAVRTVQVADTLAPALALNGPGSVALECGSGKYTEAGASASDACSGNLSSKVAISGTVNTAAVGSYPVSYSVADAAGNTASAVRTVSVSDTLAPSLALVGASAMKLECGVDSFVDSGATATDLCSGDLSSAIVKTGAVNTAAVGSYSLGYSVADAAGNTVSAVRTVQVADTLAPALTLLGASAQALECGSGKYTEAGATASDACSGDLSSKVAISGTVNTAARGAYSLTYSVADAAGNAASALRTVSVNDTQAPVVSLLGLPTLKLECGVDSFTNQGATATDLCSGDLTSAIVTSGTVNTAAVGSYPVTYKATDARARWARPRAPCRWRTPRPRPSCSRAPRAGPGVRRGLYTEAGATAVDACAGDLSSKVAISGTVNTAARGAYSLTYSVADAAGNTASALRTVSVNDTLAPVVSLLGVAAPKLECGVDSFVDAGATALDTCSGALVPVKTGTVNTAAVGTYPVTYMATDAAGLVGSAVRSVQVADTKAPALSLKGMAAMTLECGAATYTEPGASASDVCTGDLSSQGGHLRRGEHGGARQPTW